MTYEEALRPPARKDTDYDAAEYRDLVKAYAEAASVLKRQAKARAQSSFAPAAPPPVTAPRSSPTPAPTAIAQPSPTSIALNGSRERLLTSIAPKMSRALPTLLEAGVDSVETLLRLQEAELRELLAVTDLLAFDRIVLVSRLRPHLVPS